jgi:hypothetical protein
MFTVTGVVFYSYKVMFSFENTDCLRSSNLKVNAGPCHSINTEVSIN